MHRGVAGTHRVKELNIAFAVDSVYLKHALISIESVLRFPYPRGVAFWIIYDDDLDESVRARIENFAGDRAKIAVISAKTSTPSFGRSDDPVAQHVSNAMYLRLLIPDLLPIEVRRVLYLDADTLCTGPGLDELIDVDLHGKVIGAVRDAFARRMCDHGGVPHLRDYPELDAQDAYFNSGVILIDVQEWHRSKIRESAERYLLRSAEERRFPDQDALNVACAQKWWRLDKRWNHMMAWRLEAERGGTLSDATIIHSAGPVKHWQSNFPRGLRRDLYEDLLRLAEDRLDGMP